jgi:hypothetical protein
VTERLPMKVARLLAAVVLTASLYVPMVAGLQAQAACGVWRWPVKTLSDPARRAVDFDPIPTSVKRMRQRPRPSITLSTDTPRTSRTEFHTWELRARPIQAKLEDDSDVHLVISAPHHAGKTMIVEFPKPSCVASAFKRDTIRHARRQFLHNCGTVSSSSWLDLAGRVTIIGVGFWDEDHGQTGVAPNAIELHPVLSIEGNCHER